jgi:hypothetical protein
MVDVIPIDPVAKFISDPNHYERIYAFNCTPKRNRLDISCKGTWPEAYYCPKVHIWGD